MPRLLPRLLPRRKSCGGRCAIRTSRTLRQSRLRCIWRRGRQAIFATRSPRVTALPSAKRAEIVAYGVLMFAPGEAQVLNLTVVDMLRRRGIGRALLALSRRCCGARCGPMLPRSARVNAAAINLYSAEGFVPVARRAGYYPAARAGDAREDAWSCAARCARAKPIWLIATTSCRNSGCCRNGVCALAPHHRRPSRGTDRQRLRARAHCAGAGEC